MQVDREQAAQGDQAKRMDSGPLWAAAEALVGDAITQVDALRDELHTLRDDLAQAGQAERQTEPSQPQRQAQRRAS